MVLSAALIGALAGCGGGGGGSSQSAPTVLVGAATGSVSGQSPSATGTLVANGPDGSGAAINAPGWQAGAYGEWSASVSGRTLSWTYTRDPAKAPAQAATETLSFQTEDGSTHTVTVSVAARNSGLVQQVPQAVYAGTYAAEKAAVFNRLNTDREHCGFGKLAQNTQLDQAAQNHADYMITNLLNSHNEEPGTPGFTGRNMAERLTSVGYAYRSGWEIINSLSWGPGALPQWSNNSVSYTELPAVNSLLHMYASVYHLLGAMTWNREVGIGLANRAVVGDGWLHGKPLVINSATGLSSTLQTLDLDAVAVFPCDGLKNLSPVFGAEEPDPYPSIDRNFSPMGHPIYVTSAPGTTLTLKSGTLTKRAGAAVTTVVMNADNDPHKILQAHQVFLVPTERLEDNTTYEVTLSGTHSGRVSTANPMGVWTRSFSFTTGTRLSAE